MLRRSETDEKSATGKNENPIKELLVFINLFTVKEIENVKPDRITQFLEFSHTLNQLIENGTTLTTELTQLAKQDKTECQEKLNKSIFQLAMYHFLCGKLHEECNHTYHAAYPSEKENTRQLFYLVNYLDAVSLINKTTLLNPKENAYKLLINENVLIMLNNIIRADALIKLLPFPALPESKEKQAGQHPWHYDSSKNETYKSEILKHLERMRPKKVMPKTKISGTTFSFFSAPFIVSCGAGFALAGPLGLVSSGLGSYVCTKAVETLSEKCKRRKP